jgi:OOP family OmpA-OmpF porin
MKISVKLTAEMLVLGLLSGCASHQVSDRLVCATAGAIAGGLIAGVMNEAESDDVGMGIAAGAAVATLLCPIQDVPEAPACAMEAPEGALLDANGCAFDTDGDGVVDGVDQCPGTPAGVAVDALGCPLDSDGDGVVDIDDKCPGTPAGVTVNSKGCELVVANTIVSLTGVNFETNKAVLTAHARAQLDTAISTLASAMGVIDVNVEGHADSLGTETYNQMLSLKRAESVIHYLVNHGGIDASKLAAVGMGEDNPVASNATIEGRAMNRRVDFVVRQ